MFLILHIRIHTREKPFTVYSTGTGMYNRESNIMSFLQSGNFNAGKKGYLAEKLLP
jgi:hypothetical protein